MLQRPPFDLIIKVFNWKVPDRGRSWQMQTTAEKMNEWMKMYVWERGGARRAARTHTEELLQAALLRPRTEAADFTHTYTHRERKPSLGLIKRSLRRHYIRAEQFTLPCFSSFFICCVATWGKKNKFHEKEKYICDYMRRKIMTTSC